MQPSFLSTLNPISSLRYLLQHTYLLKQISRREIDQRYRGSILGSLWSAINPLLMLAVYTFVFSVVFKAKWNTGKPVGDSKTEFALIMYCGMVVFDVFAGCINRAPTLITGHANYVKKVVFPVEILPIGILIAQLFTSAVSLLILLVGIAVFLGDFSSTIFRFPEQPRS